jgi:histidine triad (HIT) family protein|tara:strand:- start:1502 stop:2125 length:624 start_codon:yes stop_codon:yes gene_type:complete
MIPQEQVDQIKKQIIQQIEATFPGDKKESAIKQIELMDSEQLEEFLKKNNLVKTGENPTGNQCIFCSIISDEIPSYKINENEDAVVILELNPISKAHVLIIPKKHSLLQKKIPKKISSLIEEISKKIKIKFKPKDILTARTTLFEHEIINLIPVYKDETIESQRYKAEKEELEEVQKILTKVKKTVVKKQKVKKISEKNLWLPRRIP